MSEPSALTTEPLGMAIAMEPLVGTTCAAEGEAPPSQQNRTVSPMAPGLPTARAGPAATLLRSAAAKGAAHAVEKRCGAEAAQRSMRARGGGSLTCLYAVTKEAATAAAASAVVG